MMSPACFRRCSGGVLVGLVLGLSPGCGQREAGPPAPEPPAAVEPISPAPAPETRPGVRPTGVPRPTAVAIPTTDPATTLNALTQALRKYSAEQQRVPATLEELAGAGYVRAVPPAPAGQQYVINRKRLTVELTGR